MGRSVTGELSLRARGWLALGSLVLFGYRWWTWPRRPGALTTEGYWGFYDQGQYLAIAESLAGLQFPDPYTYGLGYPVLAVPFIWLGLPEPFLVPNTLAFVGAIVMIAVLGARLGGAWLGWAAAGAVALASPLAEFMVEPWNSTVTVVGVLAALLIATGPRLGFRQGALLGLAVGMTFAARYVDGLFVAAVAAVALLWRQDRQEATMAALGTGGLLIVLVLWSHGHAFGSVTTTPYAFHVRPDGTHDQQLAAYDLGRVPTHFLEVFVTGTSGGEREPRDPLFMRAPLAALAPLGLVPLWKRRDRPGYALLLALAMSLLATVFYLSFRAGGGGDLKFGNIRYFLAWIPVWTIAALYGLGLGSPQRSILRRRREEAAEGPREPLLDRGRSA